MSLLDQLNEEMKTAMRAKNPQVVSCIRQVKAKVTDATKAKGFKGEVDDALVTDVISSYCKQLEKGITELGEAGSELAAQYQAEIDYLRKYLPELLGEDETRVIVKAAMTAHGVTDPKQSGRLMGVIMKDHKGKIDPGLTRRIVEEELSA
jgi:uncharacterized protein YqeY